MAVAPTTRSGPLGPGLRSRLPAVRRAGPVIRQVGTQVAAAAGGALAIALALGYRWPLFAAIFAVGALEMICSRHHRSAVTFAFGALVGVLAGVAASPAWPLRDALVQAGVGTAAALVVAVAITPADPAAAVRRSVRPLLALVSTQVRTVATALRTGDPAGAGAAVRALNDADGQLRRLDETLLQVRRSAVLVRWRSGPNLTAATTTASEIAFAVRGIRAMAQQAWWGVLRGGEPVPAALPQMLDALADGVAVLRDELDHGVDRGARRLLISSAQWIGVLRTEPLGLAAAAAAANADAAVLNLLIASGLPAEAAEQSIRRQSVRPG